ncbi:MAG: hypothetical protein ACKN9D_06700 [Actinomycetales bacterium]
MIDEPRPAIFRSLWPAEPASDAPIDHRLDRMPTRGPLHLVLLLAATGLLLTLLPAAILAALSLGDLTLTVGTALLGIAMVLLLMRAWVRGTYVNAQGYIVRRIFTDRRGRWIDVVNVHQQRRSIFGDRIFGDRIVLDRTDGKQIVTQVGTRTLDTLHRGEAADMAVLRLTDLWTQARGAAGQSSR